MVSFEKISDEILKRCSTLHWLVPNTKRGTDIVVKPWNISKETATFLYLMGKSIRAKNILELGTSAGYSTLWLAKLAKEHDGHVDTIEKFARKADVAKKHFIEAQLDKYITLHEKNILEVLKEFKNPLDFIFMDADRTNYDTYFPYLFSLLKKGGIIVVDNAINLENKGMKRFFDLCKNTPHEHSELFDIDSGLFVFIK